MKHSARRLVALVASISLAMSVASWSALAEPGDEPDTDGGSIGGALVTPVSMLDDPEDPANQIPLIQQRGTERDSLLPVSPLVGVHDWSTGMKDAIYEAGDMKVAVAFNHLFQVLSERLPDTDIWGTTTDMDFYLTWELLHQGRPSQGQIFFQVEGRWDYTTTGPTELGFGSLGSRTYTANAFSAYDPNFLIRNLYWQQGSPKAGWFYRIGKITPDQTMGTSSHLSPILTFLPIAGTGGFSNALPDSGFGISGGYSFNDRIGIVAVVSDANANRQNWGDLPEGDFYEAVDLAFKIAPQTAKAGYSKVTFWHTAGTKDGQPINGMAGPSGWGYYIKLENELTRDGKLVGLARWGQSFNDSALFEKLAGGSLLYYNPHIIGTIRNDVIGLGYSWVQATEAGTRREGEHNVEVFYRFPIFPLVDFTFSFMQIIHPAADPDNNWAAAFGWRLRTTF